MLTMKDWQEVHQFQKAVNKKWSKGERYPLEVEEDIYYHFLESLPPIVPDIELLLELWGIPREEVSEFFGNSEPVDHTSKGLRYNSFFKTKDNKYYFAGKLYEVEDY